MTTLIVDSNGEPIDPEVKSMLESLASNIGATLIEGKIDACGTCGYYDCVCEIRKLHKPECRYRKVMECMISIECVAHGNDVCPDCDKCDCGAV